MLLELEHITKNFGALTAVSDLSFSISAGEVMGIMGPNGSGKTTLLNLIMGVFSPDRGEIHFNGTKISRLSTHVISCRGIGRTFQIPQPFHQMTVLENLMVGMLYGKGHRSPKSTRNESLAIIERVGLTGRIDTEAAQLGLLDLKRLELARALSLAPRLLLLDEIAAGLVPSEFAVLKQLILELKNQGYTILIIEHILSLIFDVSDRILVLNFGQRVAEGPPEAISNDPKVQRVYLGSKDKNDTLTSQQATSPTAGKTEREVLLDLKRVNAGYGDFQALFDVSFDVRKGEIKALIGVNGAGKTTLIRIINRQLPIISGEILFRGRSIVQAQPHQVVNLGITQCIEGRKLFPELTVLENLELGAYCWRARQRRRGTLERVYNLFPALKDRSNQIAGTLSGGEQQMVAVGRALMSLPDFIMFDEISLGLAPRVIDALYEAIIRINQEEGTTVLLVEQNVHRSLAVADRASIIERGRIALSGTAEQLNEDEQVKKVYFGF